MMPRTRCDHCVELEHVGSGRPQPMLPRRSILSPPQLPPRPPDLAKLPFRVKRNIIERLNMMELVNLAEVFNGPTLNVLGTERSEVLEIISNIGAIGGNSFTEKFIKKATSRNFGFVTSGVFAPNALRFALGKGWIKDFEKECRATVLCGTIADVEEYLKIAPFLVTSFVCLDGAFQGRTDLFAHFHASAAVGDSFDPTANKNKSFCYAAMAGRLELLQWLYATYGDAIDPFVDHYTPFVTAAGGGHVHVLQWLHTTFQDRSFSNTWVRAAASNAVHAGHTNVLNWLSVKFSTADTGLMPSRIHAMMCTAAADLANCDTLWWLWVQNMPENESEARSRAQEVFLAAAKSRNPEILAWIHSTLNPDAYTTDPITGMRTAGPFASWTEVYLSAFRAAIEQPDVASARWCWENFGKRGQERGPGFSFDPTDVLKKAIAQGGSRLDIVMWICNEFPVTLPENDRGLIFCNAMMKGDMKVLQWVHETYGRAVHDKLRAGPDNPRYVTYAMHDTCGFKNLQILQWHHATYGPVDNDEDVNTLFSEALVNGNLRLVTWLHETYGGRIVIQDISVRHAFNSGHIRVLKWVDDQYGTPHNFNVENAVRWGHLPVLKWLHDKDPAIISTNPMWTEAYCTAATSGQMHVFRWLVKTYEKAKFVLERKDTFIRHLTQRHPKVDIIVPALRRYQIELSNEVKRTMLKNTFRTRDSLNIFKWLGSEVLRSGDDPRIWAETIENTILEDRLGINIIADDPVLIVCFMTMFQGRFSLPDFVKRLFSVAVANWRRPDTVRWLAVQFPHLVDPDVNNNKAFLGAVNRGNVDYFEWLLFAYGDRVNPTRFGDTAAFRGATTPAEVLRVAKQERREDVIAWVYVRHGIPEGSSAEREIHDAMSRNLPHTAVVLNNIEFHRTHRLTSEEIFLRAAQEGDVATLQQVATTFNFIALSLGREKLIDDAFSLAQANNQEEAVRWLTEKFGSDSDEFQ